MNRVRLLTGTIALLLAWFAVATIFAEILTPGPQAQASVRYNDLAARIAAAAPLRGDLLANSAFSVAKPALKQEKTSFDAEMLAARQSALAMAAESLTLAPHSSRTWLLVATLRGVDSQRGLEALKMSYLTAPGDAGLILVRLSTLAASSAMNETELKDLARGDIRLILTRLPDLKSRLADIFHSASPEGKIYIEEVVRAVDPSFVASLH